MYKEFTLLRRTLGFLAIQFFIPVIQVSFYCLCIGLEPYNLKFGIVNNETIYNSTDKTASLMFINTLDNRTFAKVNIILKIFQIDKYENERVFFLVLLKSRI